MTFAANTPLPRYRTRGQLEVLKPEYGTLMLKTIRHGEHAIPATGERPEPQDTQFLVTGGFNFRREADAEFAAAAWNFADACGLTAEDLKNPDIRDAVRALARLKAGA